MKLINNALYDLLHLLYPHHCQGCGTDLAGSDNLLCLRCLNELPVTGFAPHAGNPVEKYFWGRIPLFAAHSEFYFSKAALIQELIHQLKYKGNTLIGEYLGELTGISLLHSGRFSDVDSLVPLPLYPDREHKRGYNQAAVICKGIAAALNIPVLYNEVIRRHPTETQTRKQRSARWENVQDSFLLKNPAALSNKKLLLVDDVVTTGATLEACGRVMLQAPGTQLGLVTLALAGR